MKLEGKRVLVFGAGISGIGAADLLCKVGACPVIYDGNDKQDRRRSKPDWNSRRMWILFSVNCLKRREKHWIW